MFMKMITFEKTKLSCTPASLKPIKQAIQLDLCQRLQNSHI